MTVEEFCAELGISRQRLMTATRSAQAKMRALIAGTDDFPLLRATFDGQWEAALLADRAAENVRRQKQSARVRVRRRA